MYCASRHRVVPALLALVVVVGCRAFLPLGGSGASAASGRSSRDQAVLLLGQRLLCPPASAGEPADPPTTSAVPDAQTFLAIEHFHQDIAPDAAVKIVWLGSAFARRYAAKRESTGRALLQSSTLQRSARDRRIIDELGDRAESRLADLWCLLTLQPNGESGALLVNALPNVFYVRDRAGALGAVDAVWGGAGWEIGASPIDQDRTWPAGMRIISR